MTPSNPDTMMSAMMEAQYLTNEHEQMFTVFTNDQQRVAVNITCIYPELFRNFKPQLGVMHTLMSFIIAIGTLMNNTGLSEIMQSAFGGIPKMLNAKKFPQSLQLQKCFRTSLWLVIAIMPGKILKINNCSLNPVSVNCRPPNC